MRARNSQMASKPWLVSIADRISVLLLSAAAAVFPFLLFFPAPYGRYSSRGWGPTIPAKWAWLLQELPSLAVPALMLVWSLHARLELSCKQIFAISLFMTHYAWRALVYPFFISSSRDTPAFVWLLAFCFCSLNGFQQGNSCILHGTIKTGGVWYTLGACVWLTGLSVNIHSDLTLRRLRQKGDVEGLAGYKIPHGGLFEYISAPNYFGEIIEWAGWAVMCGNLASAAFAVFTFANLAPRAHHHHMFYKHHFSSYPLNRHAIIPFVW